MQLNGIAHIQLTVSDLPRARAFWKPLLALFEMKILIDSETYFYCIGSRTGIALSPIEPKHAPETAETKALVERFIKQNTGQASPPKKAEFFNPQTAAKRSLEEHADLVTETLARIYEKQGNIAKAIAAYERLAVKHPEKSAHFRALAKALAGR